MKPRNCLTGLRAIPLICALFLLAGLANAKKPGAQLYGDSDGNGVIEVPDLAVLNTVLQNPETEDSSVYVDSPQSRFRQDLDGNGVIEIPDLIILNSWVSGDFENNPGQPQFLLFESETLYLDVDGEVVLSATALSGDAWGRAIRTGFGVIFRISPTSTCHTAQLYGYDVAGGGTVNSWHNDKAFRYTSAPDSPEKGAATMRLRSNGCEEGQSIIVEAYIPDDIEANITPGRLKAKIYADGTVTCHVDNTPPDTAITSSPPGMTNLTNAAFSFSCDENAGCTFQCKLDSADWSACASPKNYSGLGDGSHAFQVRAIDQAGNVDPTPASYTWSINAAPPDTILDTWPPDPSNSTSASFTFHCTAPSCTYECKLDTEFWAACPSPKTYAGVEPWTATTTTNAPSVRRYHRAVWTGSEMIVWGGFNGSYLNTGGRYNPTTDSWTATSTTNAPAGRFSFGAVWTGTEMIIWGGYTPSYTNTGGRYDPATDSWTATTTTNAPSGRHVISVVWTGTEMIAWGGFPASNTGGRYYPSSNTWIATSTTNAPSVRYAHAMVWTGTKMIVWGGKVTDSLALNSGGIYDPVANSWTATSTGTNVPDSRWDPNAVWTDTEMIVWGGSNPSITFNTGGRYNPSTDSWLATSTTNAPSVRCWSYTSRGAVWTGAEMIIWGGNIGSSYASGGGHYNPLTDSWTATTTTNAPEGRYGTDIVWTGTKMIAWGGYGSSYLNTGGVYSPAGGLSEGDHTFEVRALDQGLVDPTPSSYSWTIDLTSPETIITSGPAGLTTSTSATLEFNCNETICAFECSLDGAIWSSCSSPANYSALVDGSHMFEVRATDAVGNVEVTPASYAWVIDTLPPDTLITSQPANPSNVSSAAFGFSCTKLICGFKCKLDSGDWASCDSGVSFSSLADGSHSFQVRAIDGLGNVDQSPAAYSWVIDTIAPDTNITAKPLSETNSIEASFEFICSDPACGFECRVDNGAWGVCSPPMNYTGLSDGSHVFEVRAKDTLGNWDPTPASYNWTITILPDTFITNQPDNPSNASNTLFEFICDALACTYECRIDSGAWDLCSSPKSYNGAGSWKSTSIAAAPSARRDHKEVWTGAEMIVWGGYDGSALATGGRYNPSTDSWTATSTVNAPAGRQYHTLVWTGNLMIVWGGYSGSTLNSGGRYNPATDSWNATSTGANVASARRYHSAVWTGTEMIVWGGLSGAYLNTGARYNPVTDSWIATSTTNAPAIRNNHSAVWTGTDMIVWGGYNSTSAYLNSGGKYNPAANSWAATATANAPVARINQRAAWTGAEMIVWGGYNGTYLNTGGRYDPDANTWLAVSTGGNAPSARRYHTAVWADTELIVWGGYNGSYLNDGGKYMPSTDSWAPIAVGENLPDARQDHVAVWTGSAMIIWGGFRSSSSYFNTGGVFFPRGLADGGHTFEVRAMDQRGGVDPTPAAYDWLIDLTRPETTITSHPSNPTNLTNATFSFTCSEDGCSFECNLDAQGWSICSSPVSYSSLADSSHKFQVRATDTAGNLELAPKSYTWIIDTFPPDTFIDSHPADPTNSSGAVFTFSSNKSDCTFECNLNSAGWETCDSPASYSLLLATVQTFEVRAIDWAGNADATPASFTWTIDQTPPDTAITSGPQDPSGNNHASFAFTCNDSPCTFSCSLDSSAWVACAPGINYVELANGAHSFSVRASDAVGNVDPTPAAYSWTVNSNPPDTTITSAPPNPSNTGNAAFTFTCNALACTYQCNMDGQGWSACTSPANYSSLLSGSHTFQVRAVDPLNNVDLTPASYAWIVDVNAPETIITNKPPNPTTATGAIFAFDCAGGPCTFECRLDGPSWVGCSSPLSYSGLSEGTHTFDVRAKDGADNYDPTPATWTWTIDLTPPDTFITENPPNPSNSKSALFKFNCSDPVCTYECKLDAGAWESCTSPKNYAGGEMWAPISTVNAPAARVDHRGVWTGTEMIIWSGYNGTYLNTGGRYNPSTDSWRPTSTVSAPAGRRYGSVTWTGTEMIFWGGSNSAVINTGGRYNPSTDSWIATSTVNAPTARRYHPAVWTGSRMIVWGGRFSSSAATNTGGIYNPADDSWTPTSIGANVPQGRWNHTAVWAGNYAIIWGGVIYGTGPYLRSGSIYYPDTNTWASISTTNAPSTRDKHVATWTGTKMVIWAGDAGQYHRLNTGGIYNPSTDSWVATSMTNVPDIRAFFVSQQWVWTGLELIIWGGDMDMGPYNTGGRYNPDTDSWVATTQLNAPSGRYGMDFMWTGAEMLLWGGKGANYLGDGARYTPNGGILSEGAHTFNVRAYDLLGNVDPTPATYSWTINLGAPSGEKIVNSGNDLFDISLVPDGGDELSVPPPPLETREMSLVQAAPEILDSDTSGY